MERVIRLYGCAIFMVLLIEQSHAFYCESGTYYIVLWKELCARCARGSYSVGGENATCTRCPPKGVYNVPYTTRGEGATSEDACDIPNCIAGHAYASISMNEVGFCFECWSQSYSTEGSFLTAGRGWVGCKLCEAGTYQTKHGASSCNPCQVGTFRRKKVNDIVGCSPCGIGLYQDQEGQATCKRCGVGQITTTPGSTECDSCPTGTTNRGNGSSECQVCALGFRGQNGSAPCTPCDRGQFAANEQSSQCSQCPEGKSTRVKGAKSSRQCNVCAAGYRGKSTRSNRAGRPPCVMCPIAQYSFQQSRYCIKCPVGKTTRSRGATSKEECVEPRRATTTIAP